MPDFWTFSSAGRLVFGAGAAAHWPDYLHERRSSCLIISDRALERAGLVERVAQAARQAGMGVDSFLEGRAEPEVATAVAAVDAARIARPDLIVGLGGGSNLDVAKMTAVVYAHGGVPGDYFGHGRIPGPIGPLVCLPTTAGTGSEVSHSAVLTDPQAGVKVSTLSPYLRPTLAVVDPELTWSCPRQVTADSGIDALVHAVEAYTATRFHELQLTPGDPFPYSGKTPLGDAFAEQAIRRIGRWLRIAVDEPMNTEARSEMSLAAMFAGLAFSHAGVAAVHGLEYPIGAAVHCSHGAGNGLLLPHVLEFTKASRAAELARVADWLGESTAGLSTLAAADSAIAAIRRLSRDIGIPQRLRDLNVLQAGIPALARATHGIRRLMLLTSPEPTIDDLSAILQRAW